MTKIDTVTIPKKEYDQLVRDSRFLGALESSGVDNWSWYGEAQNEFLEQYPEYEY